MDIIFEPEISLEKSLILFANYFQFDFGIRLGFKVWWALSDVCWTSDAIRLWWTDNGSKADLNLFKRDTIGQKLWSLL